MRALGTSITKNILKNDKMRGRRGVSFATSWVHIVKSAQKYIVPSKKQADENRWEYGKGRNTGNS